MVYFKQLVKEDLGCASYIVGCTGAGTCAVVDPRLDMVDEILALTSAKGLRVNAIIETHNHADHISGHGDLAERTGAPIYVHEQAGVAFAHREVKDGDELTFGVVKVRVIHTPGHRPEHIALAVSDTSRGEDPWLVLTGDSLFIGDVARPDLAVPGEEGAGALYESIFDRLLPLGDGVEIYPAHVAGSLCGRGMNAKTSSTIGFERRHNAAIESRTRAEFVRDLNEHLPQRPPNVSSIVQRNRSDYTGRIPALPPCALNPAAFQQEMQAGALIIDTRAPNSFSAGHIPGALHAYLRGSAFATRVGFIAPSTSRLLLVVENADDLREVCTQLSVVGYDHVSGYLADGMAAWCAADLPVQQLAQLNVQQLHAQFAQLNVLDVRDESEWEAGHIKGAVHLPLYAIEQHFRELDPAQPIAVICGSGERSAVAAAILQHHAFPQIINVIGGMEAWEEAGLPEAQ
jgi:glyoxylase-like metal-dependent hydrolase (beta-lactamase superfamily II)/rhodanese-related sulfurtransferase